ncbi:MAG: cobaltochelatase subunit CobN [Thermodesulfobacteriota bacterium]
MCRNEQRTGSKERPSVTKLLLPLFFILWAAFVEPGAAAAEKIKVSLLLGDAASKTTVAAVKAIYQEYPQLKDRVEFQIFPVTGIRGKNLAPLRESRLVLIFIMGPHLVEAVKPELTEVIKQGGKVYSVGGGSYGAEHQEMGIRADRRMAEYYTAGGGKNIKNLILYALKQEFSVEVAYQAEVAKTPEMGIYDYKTKKVFEDFGEYQKSYASYQEGRPWIGVFFYKNSLTSGQTRHLDAVIQSLEKEGFNVLPVYGRPVETTIEKYFFAQGGPPDQAPPASSRVRLIIALAMRIGVTPQVMTPLLSRLKVPVINAVSLFNQSQKEWEKSPVGLDILERGFQLATPEMLGIIQATVIAAKERSQDKDTGSEYIEEQPLPERIERLTARVKAWVNLQDKPNRDKKIALIYYNYPPGKQNIGASYLNVLPESLWEILLRLKSAGYETASPGQELSKEQLFHDINHYARNIGNWAPGEIAGLAGGKEKGVSPKGAPMGNNQGPVLLPLETYKKWWAELPENLRNSINKSWGPVERSNIMLWRDAGGQKYLVLPAVRYGNILFTPQPARGWDQDVQKLYHDVTLPPHHQYVAFYLWLKHGFKADAVAHIGTHGTHEWLPGKEVGFTREDPPEALIQDLPNIYPYIVDNVGEGLQAKRRGLAVIIDHLTPPFDQAGLNKELKELSGLIDDYGVAKEKSPSLAAVKLKEINQLAQKMGLLTDLKMAEIGTEDEVEEVEHYLKDIAEKQTPFGMHTFGRSPAEAYRKKTAAAILSIETGLTEAERKKRLADLEDRLRRSGPRELDSFIAALAGRYVPAGQGNDPIRNPNSLPTGNNFYAFDPTKIPSPGTYALGVKLARELLDGYRERHGQYPDKLTFNLWATETIRHEGVMDSQIMYLMGIKPKWNERQRVVGVEAIPRKELGRPRIDVTIVPSGLYRDLFANLMDLLDKAVTLAKQQTEADNLVRAHVLKMKKLLIDKGVSRDLAERLAAVRLFTEPPGAYGTNLDKVIPHSNTWDHEKQVAEVYLMRMGHLYGQGFWGDKIQNTDKKTKHTEDLSLTLLKSALAGTKLAVHSRSGNVYATLDNDDFFQYLGGTALTIRSLDGKTPEIYVTNLSNPTRPRQETLEKVMGREMRSRYLNPAWIKAMMQEGYAGARFIDKVIEHLWGWQVTVPEAVDAAKWNEMYETYVLDRNGLDLKKMFRDAKNLFAYQSLLARMLETVRKDYWKPDKAVMETLAREYAQTVQEVGLACCDHTCNNPLLTEFATKVLMSVPGLEPQAAVFKPALEAVKTSPDAAKPADAAAPADGAVQPVEGYEMQEVNAPRSSVAPIPYLFILGFLVFLLLLRWGWRRKKDRIQG